MSTNQPCVIIWLDDEEDNINLIKADVEKDIRDCGWEPVIKQFKTDDANFLAEIAKPETCIVVTDLNLLNGSNGAEVIKKLQANSLWHEVLLYSSDPRALAAAVRELDGVFYMSFNDLQGLRRKIEAVFQVFLVKSAFSHIRSKNAGN